MAVTDERSDVDVLGIGEAMVLLEPTAAGHLSIADTLDVRVAGAELNACAAVTALGGSSALLTRLGQDPLSDRVIAGARRLGVAVLAERAPRQQAGVFFKQPEAGEARSVYYYRSASAASRMDASLLRLATGVRPRAILISGLTAALGEGPQRLIVAAATREGTPPVVIDANLRPTLGRLHESIRTVRRLLPHTWVLSLGTDEGALLFATRDPQAIAEHALRAGCQEVVIKAGAGGAYWVDSRAGVHHVPPVTVTPVDTVGAGDAFTGSYVWGRLNGYDQEEATMIATRIAARVVAVRGDTEGLPRPDERASLLGDLESAGAR
jgi:2-dehydro-3-deoxygluconokinase